MAHLIIILHSFNLSGLLFSYLPCKVLVFSVQCVLLELNEVSNDLTGLIKLSQSKISPSMCLTDKKVSQASIKSF